MNPFIQRLEFTVHSESFSRSLLFSRLGHGSINENELHQGKIEPPEAFELIEQPKELTPEDDKKEGLQTFGCLIGFFVIALIIVLWIM